MADWMGNDGATTLPKSRGFFARSVSIELPPPPRLTVAVDPQVPAYSTPLPGVTLATPIGYTRNYAYPLIVWLDPPTHGQEVAHPEAESSAFSTWFPRIDDRNYVGVGLSPDLFPTELKPSVELNRFSALLQWLRRESSLRRGPVYLVAGSSQCARAWAWFLRCPQWFDGLVLLDAGLQQEMALRVEPALLSRRRLLLLQVEPTAARAVELETLASLWQLPTTVVDCRASITPAEAAGREINHWVQRGLKTAIF